jgi:hypothetical protein
MSKAIDLTLGLATIRYKVDVSGHVTEATTLGPDSMETVEHRLRVRRDTLQRDLDQTKNLLAHIFANPKNQYRTKPVQR